MIDKELELLKPCPFCGGTDISIDFCEEDCCGGMARTVECKCGACLYVDCPEEKAIESWNTRVQTNIE